MSLQDELGFRQPIENEANEAVLNIIFTGTFNKSVRNWPEAARGRAKPARKKAHVNKVNLKAWRLDILPSDTELYVAGVILPGFTQAVITGMAPVRTLAAIVWKSRL